MPHAPLPLNRASRRAFLRDGALVLTSASTLLSGSPDARAATDEVQSSDAVLRVALMTDLHYADKPPAGTRHYRETPDKLAEAADQFARQPPDLLIELGDLIDAAEEVEVEQAYLQTINRQLSAICSRRHYVLGNHCVDMLTKPEFLTAVEQERSYYSFEHGGFHFVLLDSCFREDGQPYGRKNFHWTDANIPADQLDWLAADLNSTALPVIVLAHQRLDVSNHHGVKNGAQVRRVLEQSGRVLAVFQGHSHHNDLQQIGGIPYCTLAAMIEGSGAENNGYALLELHRDHSLVLNGFRRQQTHRWPAAT